jgi:predicted dehydrogenase
VQGAARFNDDTSVDETFVGMLRFPGLELGLSDCGFRSAFNQTLEVVGESGTLELCAPFLAGLNVVMIGALTGTGAFPLSQKSLEAAIVDRVPPTTRDMNLEAFKLGIEATESFEQKLEHFTNLVV